MYDFYVYSIENVLVDTYTILVQIVVNNKSNVSVT
jgi:hypothetical protein